MMNIVGGQTDGQVGEGQVDEWKDESPDGWVGRRNSNWMGE